MSSIVPPIHCPSQKALVKFTWCVPVIMQAHPGINCNSFLMLKLTVQIALAQRHSQTWRQNFSKIPTLRHLTWCSVARLKRAGLSSATCLLSLFVLRLLSHHNRPFHSSSSHKSIRIIPLIKLSDMFCVPVSPFFSSYWINCSSSHPNSITILQGLFLVIVQRYIYNYLPHLDRLLWYICLIRAILSKILFCWASHTFHPFQKVPAYIKVDSNTNSVFPLKQKNILKGAFHPKSITW